jgi:hypothetical protein
MFISQKTIIFIDAKLRFYVVILNEKFFLIIFLRNTLKN